MSIEQFKIVDTQSSTAINIKRQLKMSENLSFTEFSLKDISVGDMGKNLTPNDYETILQEEYKIDIKNKNSLEEIRIKAHEDFIWIFLKQGTAKPRSEEVYNLDTSGYEENPRRKEQVELNKQSYLVIHRKSNRCFVSNLKKADHFADHLSLILSKEIGLTPAFKSIEEISENLKTLEEVTFVVQNNLFSDNNKPVELFEEGLSYLGIDRPDELHIKAKFINSSKIKSVRTLYKKLFGNPSFSYISCTCKDAKQLPYILNLDGICRKISIRTERNESGLYNDAAIINLFSEEFKKCYG